jgi:hypothetical protein
MHHPIRRLRPWFVLLALQFGCGETADRPALETRQQPATVASLRPARLWLYNVGLGAYMSVLDWGVDNGAIAQPLTALDINSRGQKWWLERIEPSNPDLLQIRVGHTGKCLDVLGGPGATHEFADVVQWDCLGGGQTNQLFRLSNGGGAVVRIIAEHSGKCIGVDPSRDGRIVQKSCSRSWEDTSVNWELRLDTTGADSIRLLAGHSNRCLNVFAAQAMNSANVTQYDCLDNAGQQEWSFRPGTSNVNQVSSLYQVRPNHAPWACLDVEGAGTHDGANVWLWQCLGTEANPQPQQRWRLRHSRGDLFKLIAHHSGKCLDVAGADTGNEVDVVQYQCWLPVEPQQGWRLLAPPL